MPCEGFGWAPRSAPRPGARSPWPGTPLPGVRSELQEPSLLTGPLRCCACDQVVLGHCWAGQQQKHRGVCPPRSAEMPKRLLVTVPH